MRTFGILVAGLLLAGGVVQADGPTTLVVRNVGARASRVQVAVGNTLPCDAADNRVVLDTVLEAGQTVTMSVPSACVCARSTTGGSRIDFGPSARACGGARCVPAGRGRACAPDPNEPIRVDVAG